MQAQRPSEGEAFGEAFEPTGLVEPPVRRAQPGAYGGFTLVRALAATPGAYLAEAHDSSGAPWLLQLAPLSAAGRDHERALNQQTSALLSEPDLGLRAHGGVDEPDGGRTLFWVLRWHPAAPLMAQTPATLTLAALLKIGRALAYRLSERHLLGRTEPNLSISWLIYGDNLEPTLLGAPVWIPPEAHATPAAYNLLAPEEFEPTQAGDIWRLGQCLSRLSQLSTTNEPLQKFLARLTHPDPSQRPPRASQVLAELDALCGTPAAPTVRFSELEAETLASLLLSATADSTTLDAAEMPTVPPVVISSPDVPVPVSMALAPYAVEPLSDTSPDRPESPPPPPLRVRPATERTRDADRKPTLPVTALPAPIVVVGVPASARPSVVIHRAEVPRVESARPAPHRRPPLQVSWLKIVTAMLALGLGLGVGLGLALPI